MKKAQSLVLPLTLHRLLHPRHTCQTVVTGMVMPRVEKIHIIPIPVKLQVYLPTCLSLLGSAEYLYYLQLCPQGVSHG